VLESRSLVPKLGVYDVSTADAFACWAYYLSMLSIEALWSILHLVRQNAVRMAYALTRSSFEYLIRLEYYAAHREKARIAFASIGERILYHGNNYGNLDPRLIEEMRVHQKRWKETEPEASFKTLLKMSEAGNSVLKERAKRIMTECYEIPSGFVHGSGATMMDVLRATAMADTRFDPDKSISDACMHLFCMLDILRREFPQVYGEAVELDGVFTQFAEIAKEKLLLDDELEYG
jgi:hypothetical protein